MKEDRRECAMLLFLFTLSFLTSLPTPCGPSWLRVTCAELELLLIFYFFNVRIYFPSKYFIVYVITVIPIFPLLPPSTHFAPPFPLSVPSPLSMSMGHALEPLEAPPSSPSAGA